MDDWHIYTISVEGGPPKQITNGDGNQSVPSWSGDGKWIYFGWDRGGDSQIWRVPAEGGSSEQVTKNGGYVAIETPDGKGLYVMKARTGPLWLVSLDSGQETQVVDKIQQKAFVAFPDGIYYISEADPLGVSSLRFFDLKTRQTRLILRIDSPIYAGFTVSPDRKTFLFVQTDEMADLMVLESFR
jgi:Tol biopolymer transport system component